jgi:hypothetical protein
VSETLTLMSPILPAAHAVHNNLPTDVWYLPAAHISQLALFTAELIWPARQSEHARSTASFGIRAWYFPAAHAVCLLQKLCPSPGWNCPELQAEQEPALTPGLKVPLAHCLHVRSASAVGALI